MDHLQLDEDFVNLFAMHIYEMANGFYMGEHFPERGWILLIRERERERQRDRQRHTMWTEME